MTDYKLINNENSRRYEFQIDGFIPKIEYILSENREIYLTHTESPSCFRRKRYRLSTCVEGVTGHRT